MADHPDDLDRWLAGLAGSEPAGGQRSELQTLRRVIVAEAEKLDDGSDAGAKAETQALERLLFRLRRERLLPRKSRPVWLVALAATLAVVTLGSLMLRQPETTAPELVAYGEPPVWRGALAQFEVHTANPRKRAEAFAAALRSEGQQAAIYVEGDVFMVEAELAAPLSPAVVAHYKALGLTVKPGRIRVAFQP